MNQLIQQAATLGATAAALIATSDIRVDEDLATKCSRCENYGSGMSCPPTVSGPAGFREILKAFEHAIFFRLEAPADIVFSSDRRTVFELLNQVATDIERAAVAAGFPEARAYTGGPCKEVFCHDHEVCRVLAGEGECRHPLYARESMSGFGIDVGKIAESVAWRMDWEAPSGDSPTEKVSNTYGLVLIA